jgi:hypothetical protein
VVDKANSLVKGRPTELTAQGTRLAFDKSEGKGRKGEGRESSVELRRIFPPRIWIPTFLFPHHINPISQISLPKTFLHLHHPTTIPFPILTGIFLGKPHPPQSDWTDRSSTSSVHIFPNAPWSWIKVSGTYFGSASPHLLTTKPGSTASDFRDSTPAQPTAATLRSLRSFRSLRPLSILPTSPGLDAHRFGSQP